MRRNLILGLFRINSYKFSPVFNYQRLQYSTFKCQNVLRFSKSSGNLFKVNFSCWHCKVEYQAFTYFCPHCTKLQKPMPSVTYFELFDIPRSFDVNLEKLTKDFRSIQSRLHPDKFSQKDQLEQELSAEYSSLVNKAYTSLLNPLNRALYLLKLNNITIDEDKTQMENDFLMEIMELNEEIDDADSDKLKLLEKENQVRLGKMYTEFSKAYSQNDLVLAKALVLKIKYFVSVENRVKDLKMKAL